MKDLKDSIYETDVNEVRAHRTPAREYTYNVSISDIDDEDDFPVTVTISVDAKYHKAFEEWIEDNLGDMFIHAQGINNNYNVHF